MLNGFYFSKLLPFALLGAIVFPRIAEALPLPPCAGKPYVEFAQVSANPRVRLWHADEVAKWHVPPCIRWRAVEPRVLVETAGRFRHAGDAEALLVRFGALSAMKQITYWSVTRQAWKPLFDLLEPLDNETRKARPDFTLQELADDKILYVREQESHLPGTAVFEMRVTIASSDRFQIALENIEPIRWFGITVIEPRGSQFYYAVEREGGEIWRYYNLARVIGGGPTLAIVPDASYINRAAAMFRYVAGYPTDIEPPVAPTRTQRTRTP